MLDGKKRTREEVDNIKEILSEGLTQAKGMVVDVEEEVSEMDKLEDKVTGLRIKFSTR